MFHHHLNKALKAILLAGIVSISQAFLLHQVARPVSLQSCSDSATCLFYATPNNGGEKDHRQQRKRRSRSDKSQNSQRYYTVIKPHQQQQQRHYSRNRSALDRRRRPPRLTKTTEQIEEQLQRALDSLKVAVATAQVVPPSVDDSRSSGNGDHDTKGRLSTTTGAANAGVVNVLLFPTTRECNGALASLGDAREFLRALRLFGKMTKAESLANSNAVSSQFSLPVPRPTLVTYSTLMSRLNRAGKPAIALRVWRLRPTTTVEPIDIKAVNILLHAYAKLGNVASATAVLQQCKEERCRHMPPPNLITYNTVLAACQTAGDLDEAVRVVEDMKGTTRSLSSSRPITPDIRTYTSLIATVARRSSTLAGKNDPTPAFEFLKEMKQVHRIVPNGMTYSALIDVCGRCGRSDLALQGLRSMLRQTGRRPNTSPDATTPTPTLANNNNNNEVGAWTAAINACGKAGRLDTALKLFATMPNFNVQPNTITCGCLTDSLLRAGRTADTLEVLRYMKAHGIRPSEVMYTSLMSRAETLVEREKQPHQRRDRHISAAATATAAMSMGKAVDRPTSRTAPAETECSEDTKAIEVYTELIASLVDTGSAATAIATNNKTSQFRRTPPAPAQQEKSLPLLRAFLVYQEMKNAGVKIDIPCYNTLLRACAQASDVERAQHVLRKMQSDGLNPNDRSWRLALRSASSYVVPNNKTSRPPRHGSSSSNGHRNNRKDTVKQTEAIWRQGISYRRTNRRIDDPVYKQWHPSVDSFLVLISVYMREADHVPNAKYYYERVVQLYEDVLMGSNEEMGMDRIDINSLLDSQRTMLVILQAFVMLERLLDNTSSTQLARNNVRSMATAILELDCLSQSTHQMQGPLGHSARRALQIARGWTSTTSSSHCG